MATNLRTQIAQLSQACFDAYGDIEGGFSFDHQISVVTKDRVALEIRYKRAESADVSDGRIGARRSYLPRFRFQISGMHERIFDVYEMLESFQKILRTHGWNPGAPAGDVENGDRVEINIMAVLDGNGNV